MDVHLLIEQRLHSSAFQRLVSTSSLITEADALVALGKSRRTLYRRKGRSELLSPAESGRLWKLAEVLTKATDVFGSREEAERWLKAPATALEGKSPLSLMSTPVGTQIVEQLLGRMEYGVYT
jgi:putative toxin-antitoxin system antitoxin component (TIGR02293 family)